MFILVVIDSWEPLKAGTQLNFSLRRQMVEIRYTVTLTDLGPLPLNPHPDTLLVAADLAVRRLADGLTVVLLHDTSLVQDTVDSAAL